MCSLSRSRSLDRLRAGELWDIVVVGGGATGLGTAVDAAARGYRTALLEARDFASGTSSRSTKLIHGGVRYLAQGNLALVREALHERGLLLQNAPHLVRRREFVVPAYHFWQLPYYGIGLWLYDRLAGDLSLARSRWISKTEAIARIPALRAAGLRGGIIYSDGQFDDARLAITLARTLADSGGLALNHMPVIALGNEGGQLNGVQARDAETGEEFNVRAKAVINATGAYADVIRRLDEPDCQSIVTPSQGAHIVLDRSFLAGETAIMVPRTDDGRVLFAIPWCDRVLVGTTDTSVATLPFEPRPLVMEIDFLLEHLGRYLNKAPLRSDIKSMFAGLRPLLSRPGQQGTSTARMSREHAVVVSQSGLITVTGGKWTTYRPMAKEAVDHAARVARLPGRPCPTTTRKLHGWEKQEDGPTSHLGEYGTDRRAVQALMSDHPDWAHPIHPSLPYTGAEVIWAVRQEAARTVEDVLARRTRALFFDARASIEAAPAVAGLLAQELGHDPAWEAGEAARFRELARGYVAEDL
jgi:glycerol-3-phosphate dehydrogenase